MDKMSDTFDWWKAKFSVGFGLFDSKCGGFKDPPKNPTHVSVRD